MKEEEEKREGVKENMPAWARHIQCNKNNLFTNTLDAGIIRY